MKTFALSKPSFPFATLIIGSLLGLFIVVDPFLTTVIANKVDLTIKGINVFKLYPYELFTLLFLFIPLLSLTKRLAAQTLLNTEKSFLILYLIGIQTLALTNMGKIDFSEIVVVVFLLVVLAKHAVTHEKLNVTTLDLLNLLFMISVFLPTVNNGNVLYFVSSLITVAKFLFIGFLTVFSIKNKTLLIFFLKWFVIMTTISSVIGIGQEIIYVTLGIPIVGLVDKDAMRLMIEPTSFGNFLRVPAFFGSYKVFTFFVNTALLIVFNYFLYKRPFALKKRCILISSFLLLLTALLLTFSKDAFLSLFIGLTLSVLIWRPYLIIHGFIGTLLTAVVIYLFGFVDDIQNAIYTELHIGEYRIRLQLLRDGIIGFFYNYPCLGVGVARGDRYTEHFYGWSVHNAIVQAADEVGIVGLFFYLILLCYTFLNILRVYLAAKDVSDKWISVSLLTGFVTFLTAIQFHPFFIERFTWLYMGVVQACVLIILKEKELRYFLRSEKGVALK